MNRAWSIIHVFTGMFAMVMALACCGILIQEEQRKQRAIEADLQARLERRERLLYKGDK